MAIDLRDRKILCELDMNARANIKQLARKLRLSRQVVQYRIERMKKDGTIFGAITIFDSAVIGYRWFRVVMRLRKIDKNARNRFAVFLKNHPRVIWLGEVGGNWDFVVNFAARDQFEFNEMLENVLTNWGESIQKYEVLVYLNIRDQSRQYILPGYTEQTELRHEMKFNPEIELDEVDKKIIACISRDAWMSAPEIAGKTGVSYKTVQNRIAQMEEKKVILGYRLMVHPRKLGCTTHMLFLSIHMYKRKLEEKLFEFLKQPNVTYIVKHLGKWQIGVETESASEEDFQKFLVELRSQFGEIISEYETFPIFFDHAINYYPPGCLL